VTLERPGITVVLDVNDLEGATAFWSAALGFPTQRPITQFMVLRPDDLEDHRPRMIQEQPNCIGSHCWYLMADPEGNEFCVVGD
jgi:hypothetical protein